jgi:hypothetical protein
MTYQGAHAINGQQVTAPDEEVWQDINLGDAADGLERRSPYKMLEWRKRVGGPANLDWFDFDNQRLSSIKTRSKGSLKEWTIYDTDVTCKSVSFRQTHDTGNEIVATFLIYVG